MSRLTRQVRTKEFFMCGHQKETIEVIPVGSLHRSPPDIYEQLPRRFPCEECMPHFAKELKLREMGITEHRISNGNGWAAKLDAIDNDPLFSDGSLYFPATGQTITHTIQHIDPTESHPTKQPVLPESHTTTNTTTKDRVPSLGFQKAAADLVENLQRAQPPRVRFQDKLNDMDMALARRNEENEQAMKDYFKRVDKQNRNKKWRSACRRPRTFA